MQVFDLHSMVWALLLQQPIYAAGVTGMHCRHDLPACAWLRQPSNGISSREFVMVDSMPLSPSAILSTAPLGALWALISPL